MINVQHSLSKKILFMVAAVFMIIGIFLYGSIGLVNKQTFYKLEGDKADLIVKNYAPFMAMQLYLGMEEKLFDLSKRILQNESVLEVAIFSEKDLVMKNSKHDVVDGIRVSAPIYKPNSKKKIGKLQIVYSTKHFEALMKQYTILMAVAIAFVALTFLMLNRYIQKLLQPLKRLAYMLRGYSPDVDMELPYLNEKNEIGMISNALNISHQKTLEYSVHLQNLNETLEEKVLEKTKKLETQLFTESTTDLPNRLALINTLKKSSKDGVLAIICLDNYKEINNFYGHEIGDGLLIAIKEKIEEFFYYSDYKLYKLPGNEFALYSKRLKSKMVFSSILYDLENNLNKNTFFIKDFEINSTFTIGASVTDRPLLEKADIALQEAYRSNQPIVIYNSSFEIEKKIDNNIQMIKKIKCAIKNDRIVPYFQPIYDNETGQIKSYESLVRLIDEDGKVLSPYFFLDIAKKAKLYKQIARIMITKSCMAFESSPYSFSLNFEIDDVVDEELVKFTMNTMRRYGVTKQVAFEILESESIEDIDAVTKFTQYVADQGCKVYIDDFGSGYSNFLHVLKLKADYLKIDGSLIRNIHQDAEAKIIVQSIVKFAKELGIKTVAEFVHCKEVQDEVEKLSIDCSQGYFLGEPKPELVNEEELAFA